MSSNRQFAIHNPRSAIRNKVYPEYQLDLIKDDATEEHA